MTDVQVRRADPRIEQVILDALGSAATVVNVGAGTGSHVLVDDDGSRLRPAPLLELGGTTRIGRMLVGPTRRAEGWGRMLMTGPDRTCCRVRGRAHYHSGPTSTIVQLDGCANTWGSWRPRPAARSAWMTRPGPASNSSFRCAQQPRVRGSPRALLVGEGRLNNPAAGRPMSYRVTNRDTSIKPRGLDPLERIGTRSTSPPGR